MTEEERDAADPWLTLAEIAEELRVNPGDGPPVGDQGSAEGIPRGRTEVDRAALGARAHARRDEAAQRMPAPASQTGIPAANSRVRSIRGTRRRMRIPRSRFYQIAGESLRGGVGRERVRPAESGLSGSGAPLRRLVRAPGVDAARTRRSSRVFDGSPRTDFGPSSSLRGAPGGNRPGAGELWRDFDAALDRLVIAVSGTEVTAVAHASATRGGDARRRRRARARRQLAGRIEGWMTALRSCARSSLKCFVERIHATRLRPCSHGVLGSLGRMTTRPPRSWRRGRVRVVMRPSSGGGQQGRRRADRGHELGVGGWG